MHTAAAPSEDVPEPQQPSADHLLMQVDHSLAALANVADQVTTLGVQRASISLLFDRIDFNARRAEEAMRVLRDFPIANSRPVTELSQSLTVIVLVADMVISGHLSPTSLGDEELFYRNLIRARTSLAELCQPAV